jgi:hypothetical protein
MRALDAVPDGRSDTVAATTSLPQFPADELNTGDVVDLVTARTYATVDTRTGLNDMLQAVPNGIWRCLRLRTSPNGRGRGGGWLR